MLFGILGVVLWVLLALWPAMVASRKGHSFFLFFLISIPWWFIGLIIAYAVSDRTATPESRSADKAADKALEEEYDE